MWQGNVTAEWAGDWDINLGDGLATGSQPAVHSDSLTVDVADGAGHEPLAGGHHAKVEPGNL